MTDDELEPPEDLTANERELTQMGKQILTTKNAKNTKEEHKIVCPQNTQMDADGR